jgi:serine/threonine protein kinase
MSGSTASLPEQSDSGEHERLGRFSLLRIVGRGASAVVYEALDTRMERPVALKVLSFDPLLSPEQRQRQIERFEREARAVARLSHPNIVAVFDVGEEDGKHFLVMELLSGVTLRERLEQGGPIALVEATSLVEQIASALDFTHAEGIVHRDIKPSNILLMPDGRVKMLDFGIARRGEDATVTHTGMLIGSPAYMSPEQGRGENASPASDIWALGALLYEMLTGHAPFDAPNIATVLYKAAYDDPLPLPEDVSRAQKVVSHALAKKPEERYATAGALANALRTAADFPPGPGRESVELDIADTTSKQTLQNAAASAFTPSSESPTASGESLLPPLGELSPRRRSRFSDLGVLAAWGAVVIAALGIVTMRMRQTVFPTTQATSASSMKSAPTIAATSPVSPTVPSVKPTSTPEVRIVEVKPTPPAAVTPKIPVATPPMEKPDVTPVPSPRAANTVKQKVAITKPLPKASKVVQAAKAPSGSVEPPWDDRLDRLGDPEPEPKPQKTATPEPSSQTPAPEKDTPDDSGKAQYKPSILLGRWKGNVWKRNATLNIQSSDSDSFLGTLTLITLTGRIQYSIQGTFSPVTGRVSFWSPDAPQNDKNERIDIGQSNGRLISTKTMGGLGLDSNRRVFTWSFSR